MNIKLVALVSLAVVVVLTTCVACGPSTETAVVNDTSAPLIAETHDSSNFPDPDPVDRYFAVRPGETIVVDTVGGQNPATDKVVILDATCNELERVTDDFSNGATISLVDGGQPQVQLGRSAPSTINYLTQPDANGLNGDSGFKTCADAAAKIVAP